MLFRSVSKECRNEKFLLPVVKKDKKEEENQEGYEGAIVLYPYSDIYYEPVVVSDYNSLYPSSMISHNLSHDTFIIPGSEYEDIPGIETKTVVYDNYMYVKKGAAVKKIINQSEPKKYCKFVQPKKDEDGNIINETRGVIPKILQKLLSARKATRLRIKTEPDPFKCQVQIGRAHV